MVGRSARFDAYEAGSDRLEESQHLTAWQLPPYDDRAVSGDTVNLENSLRQIEPDDRDGLHDNAPGRDVPDDDAARTAGREEVVHTITSSGNRRQAFAGAVIDHRQDAEPPTIGQLI